MSEQWILRCEACEEDGPDLRRSAGGIALLNQDAWARFLLEHGYHRPRLSYPT